MLLTLAGVDLRPPGLQSDGASNWATKASANILKYFFLFFFFRDNKARQMIHMKCQASKDNKKK